MDNNQYLQVIGIQTWQLRESDRAPQKESNLPRSNTIKVQNLDWAALRTRIEQCTLCDLHQSRTQTVFGVGSQQADLMIIGEAPGFHEDKQGEPFVGRAGQLLTAMLTAIGLARDDAFIANILKCRPPNNRDPLPAEVKCCTPYLTRQIELIQPKLIVAIGRIAAQFLLDTSQALSRLRNKPHQYQGTPLIVTYHPAYLLRSPREKTKAWRDWQVIASKLK